MDVPTLTELDVLDWMTRVSWVASSRSRYPHEYVVKDRLSEDGQVTFLQVVTTIHADGADDLFLGRYRTRYYFAGGWKLWCVGDPDEWAPKLAEHGIINRERRPGW